MSDWDVVSEAPAPQAPPQAPARASTGRPYIEITPNPPTPPEGAQGGGNDPWSVVSEAPAPAAPGVGEAAARGFVQGGSLGFGDEEAGALAAGDKQLKNVLPAGFVQGIDQSGSPLGGVILRALLGAGRVGYDKLTGQTSDVSDAYTKTRDSERAANAAAEAANPGTYTATNIAGGLAAPLPGGSFLKGANWLSRLGRGVVRAAPEGAAVGVGNSTADNPTDLSLDALKSAGLATVLGGPVNAAIGPRAAPVLSRAAQTADANGAPLPVGLASTRPWVQQITKAAEHLPIVGTRISNRAEKAVRGVGEQVNDMVQNATGGATDRAATGAMLRPALEKVVEDNNAKTDAAYNTLRGSAINADARVKNLPSTDATLQRIAREREVAGAKDGYAGFDDVKNIVQNGTTFNGLQRARAKVGKMIDFPEPNAGIDAGDLKRLYGAMTKDMFGVATATRRQGVTPQQATAALRDAHEAAAEHIEANKRLSQVLRAKADEGLAGAARQAANNKGGNVGLLAQLRGAMRPADFEHVAGTVLHELGYNKTRGEFSLNQFSREWNNLAPAAKRILFKQSQRAQLDDFAHFANHLRDADKFTNHSGSGRQVVFASLLAGGGGLAAGEGGTEKLKKYGGGIAVGAALASLLGRPATAATMGRFARAWTRVGVNPDAASVAMFKIATRNVAGALSDQLGQKVDVSDVPALLLTLAGGADKGEDEPEAPYGGDLR